MWQNTSVILGAVIALAAASLSCERDTTLSITGDNPPTFVMSGSGVLTTIRVRGNERQRDAEGEDQYLYWVIVPEKGGAQHVSTLESVTYGKVPPGYRQKYPESGDAPPIIDGQRYYIQVLTNNANGASGYFTIQNGKVLFEK